MDGQSEAQSSEEFMEFQNLQGPQKTTTVKIGDFLKTPYDGEGGGIGEKGWVTSMTDSALVVKVRKSGEERSVRLNEVPKISVINRSIRKGGWVTFGLGVLSHIPWSISVISFTGVTGYFGVLFLAIFSIFTNPFFWLGLALSFLIWMLAKRTIWMHKWKWKRKRMITLKKKGR